MNDHRPIGERTPGTGAAQRAGGQLDALPVALVVTDRAGRIMQWEMAAQDLLGYPESEAVGRDAGELVFAAEDRTLARALRQAVVSGRSVLGTFTLRHKDGHQVELEMWACPPPDRLGDAGVLVLAADALAARRLRGMPTIPDGLFTASPIGLAVFDTELRFQQVNPALQAMNGASQAVHAGRRLGQVLTGVNTAHMEAAMRRVLDTGEPVLDVLRVGRTPANPEHDRVWSCSYFRLEDQRGRPLGISASIVDITAHEQDVPETESSRRRLTLLNEASIRIGTTLDLQRTAQEFAEVAVPRLADVVTVDLLEAVTAGAEPGAGVVADATLRRMGKAPAAGSAIAALLAPVGGTLSFPAFAPYTQSLTDRQPFLIARLDARVVAPAARYTSTPEQLLHMGVHSLMMAPLIARSVVLGVATFFRTEDREPFDSSDVTLACDMAARAAVCVDNARLYSREHDTALTLQRSMLPQRLTPPAGIEIAHCYLPADDVNEAGGDWYDVIPLPSGKAALVVGDVMGHGIPAAAVMGQLRSTVRALARLELSPSDILSHLDATLNDLAEPLLATCVYAVCDPHTGRCSITRAGHPPPAVVDPDGTAQLLKLPAGVPLGIGGIDFMTTEVSLAPGSLLVLYTDGLVEARGHDLDEGFAELTQLLTGPGRPLPDLCDTLVAHLAPASADDIALLIARIGTP